MEIRSLEEVMRMVKALGHEETRRESEDYLELVTSVERLILIGPLLESYFGPAFKTAGSAVTEPARRCAKRFGGVDANQILYYTERESAPSLAMIWPWGDGRRATVKIAHGCLPAWQAGDAL